MYSVYWGCFPKSTQEGINPKCKQENKTETSRHHNGPQGKRKAKGSDVFWSKSCRETWVQCVVAGKHISIVFPELWGGGRLFNEKHSISTATRPGGPSGPQLTGTGSGWPGPPLPGPARPHLSAGTLTLEPDQLPRAHDWLLTDRNLKPRRYTRMPHYWLGDWQDIWSNEKLGYYCGPDFLPGTVHTLALMVPLLPRKGPCQSLRLYLQGEREWVP